MWWSHPGSVIDGGYLPTSRLANYFSLELQPKWLKSDDKHSTSPYLADSPFGPYRIELAVDEFETLLSADVTLQDARNFEHRYDMVLSEYREFELGLTRASLSQQMGFLPNSHVQAMDLITLGNRLLMNLMTVVRAHIDHTLSSFKTIDLAPGVAERFKTLTNAAYDKHFEYRFMEALRNHSQHRELPVHGVVAGGSLEEGVHWAETLALVTRKADLIAAGKFKASVLDEMPARVNLRTMVRVYVQALSEVHLALREAVTEYVVVSREHIQSALDRFTSLYGMRGRVTAYDPTGAQPPLELQLGWDDARAQLVARYSQPFALAKYRSPLDQVVEQFVRVAEPNEVAPSV